MLAMICGTLARIGNEVYELQRPEIGELREPTTGGTVGSITMPHKRNPEGSEHLDTLARLVRANAAVLLEGMVGGHERDGRGWKAEWVALPEVCLLTAAALQRRRRPAGGPGGRRRGDAGQPGRHGDYRSASGCWRLLTPRLGKHAGPGRAAATSSRRATAAGAPVDAGAAPTCGLLEPAEAGGADRGAGAAGAMVDLVVARARAARGRGGPDHGRDRAARGRAGRPAHAAGARRRGWPRRSGAGPLLRQARRPDRVRGRRQQGPRAGVPARAPPRPRRPTSWSPAAARARTSAPPPRPRPGVAGLDCVLVFAGTPGAAGRTRTWPLARAWGAERPLDRRRRTGHRVDAALPRGRARELAAAGPPAVRRPARRRHRRRRASATGWPRRARAPSCDGRRSRRTVVVATGSGGTLAGLVAGRVALGRPWRVVGASVSRPPRRSPRQVLDAGPGSALRRSAASRRRARPTSSSSTPAAPVTACPRRRPGRRGELALRTEGLVLDPVYTAQGAGRRCRRSVERPGPALFWHTGGLLDAVAGTDAGGCRHDRQRCTVPAAGRPRAGRRPS